MSTLLADPERLADAVAKAIEVATAPLLERIQKLEKRCKQLEARPQMEYRGVWDEKTLYAHGSICTYGGSMWHAQRASIGRRPGQSDDWKLCVKRGSEGKQGPKGEKGDPA